MFKIKNTMTHVDIYAWIQECGGRLSGRRIVNIYWTGKYWLIKIHGDDKKYLVIDPSRRICVSSVEPRNKGIDKFSAYLRKYINGGFIKEINVINFERIVSMKISKGNAEYKLYVEIIPRGAAILADHDNTILYATKFMEMRDRSIKPGIKYVLPPGRVNIFEISSSELKSLLMKGKDVVRGLVRGWGLPGEVAEEILYRSGLYDCKHNKPETLSETDVACLIDSLNRIYTESRRGIGYLIKKNDQYISFTPYEPRVYTEVYGFNSTRTSSFNDAVDSYFTSLEALEEAKERERALKAKLEKIERAIIEQERLIKEYLEKARHHETIANTIAMNYTDIERMIYCANTMRERYGWDYVVKCSGIVGYDMSKGIIEVVIRGLRIPLDIRIGASGTMTMHYRLAGEYKSKAERARQALEELKKRRNEILNRISEIKFEVLKGVRPRLWYERYHWMITSGGYLVIAGRDASQNEAIVRKHLEPNDIFLHADIHGAPATIIKTRGREIGEKDIVEAAYIAACYSKAWKLGIASIDVYWVKGSQVSKAPPSGEYLAKGAFMIYGKRNYIHGIALKLALGIEPVCDEIYGFYERVIVGPEELVKERSIVYAIIVPGETDPSETAAKIIKKFNEMIQDIPILITDKEVLERIPGRSRIIGFFKGSVKKDQIECLRE